jgi:hypothetical protein
MYAWVQVQPEPFRHCTGKACCCCVLVVLGALLHTLSGSVPSVRRMHATLCSVQSLQVLANQLVCTPCLAVGLRVLSAAIAQATLLSYLVCVWYQLGAWRGDMAWWFGREVCKLHGRDFCMQ